MARNYPPIHNRPTFFFSLEMEPRVAMDRIAARIAAEAKRPPAHDLQRPRVQFNLGYWDGISLTARGGARQDGLTEETILAGHPNPFYAYGCLAGAAAVRGTGPHGTSSDPAWNEFLASLTDPDLIFQIEANP